MATRRHFVGESGRLLVAGAIARAAAPLLGPLACSTRDAKPPLFEATFDVAALAADGQTLVTPTPGFDAARILIVRTSPRGFRALSMQCTHEGCPVNPPVGEIITCPCHGSRFDLEGNVRQGPAQFPLARYATTYTAKTHQLTVRVES